MADHALPEQDDESLWGILLDYIDEGTVVPVVGRDLLTVTTPANGTPAHQVPLYSLIAAELAKDLLRSDVEAATLSGPNPLGAASEYIVRGRNRRRRTRRRCRRSAPSAHGLRSS